MNRFFTLHLAAFLLLTLPLAAQERYTLSGYVRDAGSGEALPGANVAIRESGRGTVSNEYGYFALRLESGDYDLLASYVGYASLGFSLPLIKDTVLDLELIRTSHKLEEVSISGQQPNNNITNLESGATRLDIQSIRKIPAFLGEVDVIKAIQLLPGVQITSEGSSGFSVRGGARDQNLVLMDEAPIYSPSHFLGFFSVFNNDAIKDVKLYKGDIPAQSGGRLASLLDVRMKEGNSKQFSVSGGLGTISSRLSLEGPIVKDKASFLLSGRRTYADLFLLFSGKESIRQTRLNFYDLNGKINFKINPKNRIYLSAYKGRDMYASKVYGGLRFGNRTLTLSWNHLFSSRLFSNFSLVSSKYFYELGTPEESSPFLNWNSSLDEYGLKEDFTLYLHPEHTLRFGAWASYYYIQTGDIKARQNGIDMEAGVPSVYAAEGGGYISGESDLGDKLRIRYGLRWSVFSDVGPTRVYNYDQDYQVVDSISYGQGEFYNLVHGAEPRLVASYILNDNQSLKASYSRTRQYLHLASNATAGMALEVWFPASPNVKPQLSDHVSIGYFRNFLDHKLETSLELYYKKMNNAIEFRDHAQLILNPRLDGELRRGSAQSWGAELYLRYQSESLSGWIAYTLSRTFRDIPEINEGNPYPAPYDKPHDLSIVLNYDPGRRIYLSANWIFSSGLPYTLPSGRYEIMGSILPIYTGRNQYRLPAYHRLDLSLNIRGKQKAGKRWRSEWNFSVYNAYARKNVWALNFIQDPDQPEITYAEMTYLFSIVPAITYNFTF